MHKLGVQEYVEIHWLGDSREVLSAFPQDVKTVLGYSLRRLQTRMEDALYVLHAFEKKSRKTDRRDIEIAKSRLQMLLASRK